jgi:hypothetical protein
MRGVGVGVGCCRVSHVGSVRVSGRVGLVLCMGPTMATGRLDLLVAAGGQRGMLCIVTIGV